ncbi:hypothetical protein Tco_0748530 [Tanacetum coccineum]|uniref:Uncharacterized protein n=1 Tax=Tanacetum coccineum TaxID=301880 RepID=A0ABQ4YVY6_9ASTR
MVVRTLNVEKDHFRPINDDDEIPGIEVPFLSVMGALLFLSSHTRLDISFPLNLLARQEAPIVVHEDDATCIAQHNDGYIKGDKTKRILPKFFFTHDL